ncbi:MAG: glycoside hydrolase family 3 protein [Microbacteriaceae bacterium]|nr:glycoside hydrolase family 3 protein [Microbacteriaceae bacterium]
MSTLRRISTAFAAAAAAIALLSACGGQSARPSTSSPTVTNSPTPAQTIDPLAGLSIEQKVGQLFVVGSPATAAGAEALSAITNRQVDGVFLSGRSTTGTAATRAVVQKFTAAASGQPGPLLITTDQEGGEVQVLSGPGFETISAATAQGAEHADQLEVEAARWGRELASAGVNLNLAPVADVVPSAAAAPANAPIGALDRQFGFDEATVETHAGAVMKGMQSVGVFTAPKHFPGLGNVAQNTDTSSDVTDTTTTADSPSVRVVARLFDNRAQAVMVSTPIYAGLDPGVPAAFSPKIVEGLLRSTLGFTGVVITDDLSGATQVAPWPADDRGILSIQVGDDLVLVCRDPQCAASMIDAVVQKARNDPTFAAQVDAAARRVLAFKSKLGAAPG